MSCVCCQFHLAVSAGRKQQQIAEQLLVNHFIFTALNHQLPHLLTQNTQKVLTENNRIRCISQDYSYICESAQCLCLCSTNLMLEQNPVNEQRSNVLLFPMKLH